MSKQLYVLNQIILVIFISLFGQITLAQNLDEANESSYLNIYLEKFNENPNSVIDLNPPKFSDNGNRINLKKKYSIEQKEQLRKSILKGYKPLAEISHDNQVANFFPTGLKLMSHINELKNMTAYKMKVQPWSGDYWATYRGGIGVRYNANDLPESEDYMDYENYQNKNSNIDFNKKSDIDNLSPSEKYDILVGDENFSLTKWSYYQSHLTYESNSKKVPTWFGICHGWAPASIKVNRPQKSIVIHINNFKGQSFDLRFYPDDIKALASLQWANGTYKQFYVGDRCEEKNPKKDENGRVVNDSCFDINPASWHQITLNQMNGFDQSFVMDAVYDDEVWNHPISKYKLTYFNPQTGAKSDNAEGAIVSLNEFSKDKFKKYRSPKAAYVVGVSMSVSFVAETDAVHEDRNSEDSDYVKKAMYIYDLEVDASGNLIGGEWYQNKHPDFVWTPEKNAVAKSFFDNFLMGNWSDLSKQPPYAWKFSASKASSNGNPLNAIVEKLVELSNR